MEISSGKEKKKCTGISKTQHRKIGAPESADFDDCQAAKTKFYSDHTILICNPGIWHNKFRD